MRFAFGFLKLFWQRDDTLPRHTPEPVPVKHFSEDLLEVAQRSYSSPASIANDLIWLQDIDHTRRSDA